MEQKITFQAETFHIEGLISSTESQKRVVITHPHPLFGGDMYNQVVSSLTIIYQKMGYQTLRFNFRGVGRSQGTYSDGIGEQQDVIAATDYFKQIHPGPIDLAGYSFGAWVNVNVVKKIEDLHQLMLISPPVDFIQFDDSFSIPMLRSVISGSNDEYASVDHVSRIVKKWNPNAQLNFIKGADHFFSGCISIFEKQLQASLMN